MAPLPLSMLLKTLGLVFSACTVASIQAASRGLAPDSPSWMCCSCVRSFGVIFAIFAISCIMEGSAAAYRNEHKQLQ